MPVMYSTGAQTLKLRIRNNCLVGVCYKISKNSLRDSWYADNPSCIFLCLYTAEIFCVQNKNILYFLQLCPQPL